MRSRDDGPVEFDLPIEALSSPAADARGSKAQEPAPASRETSLEGEEREDPVVAFSRMIGMFAAGVTLVTTTVADRVHGMTAGAFVPVSLDPPLVVLALDGRATMLALLTEGTRIGISVLSEEKGVPVRPARWTARWHGR